MTLGDQGLWKWGNQGRLCCWTNESRRTTEEVRRQSFHREVNRSQRWRGTFLRSYSGLGIKAGMWNQIYPTSEPGSNHYSQTSLVVQCLRIHLPGGGGRKKKKKKNPPAKVGDMVRSLVGEDPTCLGAANLRCHDYWSLRALEPEPWNKRSYHNEKPTITARE